MTTTPAGHPGEDLSRVLTVPNFLSLCRLGLLSVFAVLLFVDDERIAAAALLAVAGTTDFLDGYVARRFHQVSNVGKVLDPTVDRLVLGTAIVSIVVVGAVPIWLAALVLARECFVALLALSFAALGAARIDVTFVGKAGTFGLLCAFPFFLAGSGQGNWGSASSDVAWVIVVPALAFSLASMVSYVPRALQALRDGRTGRSSADVLV